MGGVTKAWLEQVQERRGGQEMETASVDNSLRSFIGKGYVLTF